jgi:hypothetical protein
VTPGLACDARLEQLLFHLGEFARHQPFADRLDDAMLHRQWLDRRTGRVWFVVADLLQYLSEAAPTAKFTETELMVAVVDRGVQVRPVRLANGSIGALWSLPLLDDDFYVVG